jgi:hypothetical protein
MDQEDTSAPEGHLSVWITQFARLVSRERLAPIEACTRQNTSLTQCLSAEDSMFDGKNASCTLSVSLRRGLAATEVFVV